MTFRNFLAFNLIAKMEEKLEPKVNLFESIYLLDDAWKMSEMFTKYRT